MLGADAALAVPDTRAERTVNQIISPQAYNMLFQRCAWRRLKHALRVWRQCGTMGLQPVPDSFHNNCLLKTSGIKP